MSAGWLRSARWDGLFMLGPLALAFVIAMFAPLPAGLGLLGFVVLVVGVDVAHVYASLWRVWADPEWRERHATLAWAAPLGALLGCLVLNAMWREGFWTVLAYVAVWHFVRQGVGVAALYRARAGRPTRDLGGRVERGFLGGLMLWPVLWWHAHPELPIVWFVVGDFLPGLPSWAPWLGLGPLVGLGLWHGWLRTREGGGLRGGDLWVLLTGLCWVGGIVLRPTDAAFSLTNIVAHGVPYLALVWLVGERTAERGEPAPAWTGARRVSAVLALLLFLVPLLALALVEESAWDLLVWQQSLPPALHLELPDWVAIWAVPWLATPQVTHYVMDGYLWRLGQDPALRARLMAQD